MKKILSLLIILISQYVYSQEWKKIALLKSGDTVFVTDRIKINTGITLQNVQPSLYDVNGTPFNAQRIERNKRYTTIHMPGNTYKITRLSRVKVSGKYVPIAVLVIGDYSMSPADNTPFTIYLDNAIESKEITIIK